VSSPASVLPGAPPSATSSGAPYRIMVVDDSAVIRGLLIRSLESDAQIEVVASVSDGRMAVNALSRHDVEVVVLDIEMPVMDGLTALPQLIAARPGVKVIIASTLSRRNADISLQALAAGAADYIAKPGATALTTADAFKQELVAKIKALGEAKRKTAGIAQPAKRARPEAARRIPDSRPIALRAASLDPFEVLAIGSSTGGPQALFQLLTSLRGTLSRPIFITQHMPSTFTTILAEHICRSTGWPAAEAVDGEIVRQARVYVAPGDFHMLVELAPGGEKIIRLSKAPAENFCRPAVDPMLRSLAQVHGRRLLTVVLTGMGHDGLDGSKAVAAAGGTVVAQDEATSVVWGMPGAVATAGLCSAVLPLAEIGAYISKLARRVAA
jgi:two-component system, chemotaxis family, protein-glutamate methylesterase/glutaminase